MDLAESLGSSGLWAVLGKRTARHRWVAGSCRGHVLGSEAPERDQEGMNWGRAFMGTRWPAPDRHLDRAVFPGAGATACGACGFFASVCSLPLTSPDGRSLCASVPAPPWQAGTGTWLLSCSFSPCAGNAEGGDEGEDTDCSV